MATGYLPRRRRKTDGRRQSERAACAPRVLPRRRGCVRACKVRGVSGGSSHLGLGHPHGVAAHHRGCRVPGLPSAVLALRLHARVCRRVGARDHARALDVLRWHHAGHSAGSIHHLRLGRLHPRCDYRRRVRDAPCVGRAGSAGDNTGVSQRQDTHASVRAHATTRASASTHTPQAPDRYREPHSRPGTHKHPPCVPAGHGARAVRVLVLYFIAVVLAILAGRRTGHNNATRLSTATRLVPLLLARVRTAGLRAAPVLR